MFRSIALAGTGLAAAMVIPGAAQAQAPSGYHCAQLISHAEARRQIPRGLLMAIAMTESGNGGQPSPYAMNIAGRSHFAKSLGEMAQIISTNWQRGVTSIDVGCMQINLKYHGSNFSRLTDLLDSTTNVDYGASYLIKLATERGSWREGVMDYHNKSNPARRSWYGCRVWNNYLRIIHATSGFLNCPRTPTGSSVASRASEAQTPLVIPGYNDSRQATFAHASAQQASRAPVPTSNSAAAFQRVNMSVPAGQIPTGHPLDANINAGPAYAIPVAPQVAQHEPSFDVPQPRQRVLGTIELAEANNNLADVTTSADPRAGAFQAVRPVDWSERQSAFRSAAEPPATSRNQGGFSRLTPGSH